MRRFAFPAAVFCLVFALTTGVVVTPAFADTYKIYDLGGANANVSFGLTDNGTAVVRRAGACNPLDGSEPTACFYTYEDGVKVSTSETDPALMYDNGVACTPSAPVGVFVFDGKCNGAYDAFGGDRNLYVGLVGMESILSGYVVSALQLNAVGDAFWTDGSKEEIFEAVVTPEPSTFALLGSGLLGAAAVLRRRVIAH